MSELTRSVPPIDPHLIATLKERVAAEVASLAVRLREQTPATKGADHLTFGISQLMDSVLVDLVRYARDGARSIGQDASPVTCVALGGYGRQELCPKSDVDLLFLLPDGASVAEVVPTFVNQVLYGLWDLGFEIGHATRTVAQCQLAAKGEHSVLTALIEARLVDDPHAPGFYQRSALFRELERQVTEPALSGSEAMTFVEEKLREADKRRAKYGNSIFLLEPDVKHGEGGLRELHTALWIARARFAAKTVRDLLHLGILGPAEANTLERAYGFLLRVRTELHLVAKRRRDALGFEFQERVAECLGYVDPAATERKLRLHGTERFMRAYYFHASNNRRISRLIIERATSEPHRVRAPLRMVHGGFKLFDGRLTVVDRDQFRRDPGALLRIFRVAQEESLELYSYTKDLIRESIFLISRSVRRDPSVVGDFLDILEHPRADGSVLELMHDLGVLRRMIPEFARVTARWQHSHYHVYTVDVHSLFVVKLLKRLRLGAWAETQPELSRLLADLPRPAVLYLAAFLHDVGKGWSGDHSQRGGKVSAAVGSRLEAAGLPTWGKNETRDLVWLVEQHLLASHLSQRRDLTDRELLAGFAAQCETEERLAMLYLLTYADMNGTSPKVWNDWKGSLLRELYHSARDALLVQPSEGSGTGAAIDARRLRAQQEMEELAARDGLTLPPKEVIQAFVAAVPERYLTTVPSSRMVEHLVAWREVKGPDEPMVQLRQRRSEGVSELLVICVDRPGLLAMLAGTFAASGLEIISAEIFSVGLFFGERGALDVLSLRDADGSLCADTTRWDTVRADLSAVIRGEKEVAQLMRQRMGRSTLSRRPRPTVETKVVMVKDASKTESVLDVFCPDHLGALYVIAQTLADQGLTIRLAKISTEGDRVIDAFYFTDVKTQRPIDDPERERQIVEATKAAIERSLSA